MGPMISFQDYLGSLMRLLCNPNLRRLWPRLMEKAGKPETRGRFKILQCERLFGAEIKGRYQWPAKVPDHLEAL